MKKKTKKKGFTIVELLVVIAIMLSILGIVIFSVNKVSKTKKEEAYKEVKKEVLNAGKQYFETNEYLFEGLGEDSIGTVPLYVLVREDYINSVVDPRDGKKINLCNEVIVTKKDSKYITKYNENNSTKCDVTNHGVVVKEPGAPSLKPYFYRLSDNKKINKINSWLNINDLGKGNTAGVKLNVNEAGNGPIVEVTAGNKLINKTNDDYYDTINYSKQTNCILEVSYTVTNSSGKKARAIISGGVDTIAPTATISINSNWTNVDKVPYHLEANDYNSEIAYGKSYWNNSKFSEAAANNYSNSWNDKTGQYNNPGGSNDIKISGKETVHSDYFYAEGVRKIKAKVCDNAGNCVFSNEGIARIDHTKPNCTINVNGTLGNKINGKQWYIKNNVSIGIKSLTNDSYSPIVSYGLATYSNPTNSSVNGTQSSETSGVTWHSYIKDQAGNSCTSSKSFALEKNVTLTFDVNKTNNTKSIKSVNCSNYNPKYDPNGKSIFVESGYKNSKTTVNNLNHNNKPCKFGQCTDIKCTDCDRNYFARSCMYVNSYQRYFTANSISGGHVNINTEKEASNGIYEEFSNGGRLYYSSYKNGSVIRNGTVSKNDARYCLHNSNYTKNQVKGESGLHRDDFYYVSPAGSKTSSITLVVEYVAKCGFYGPNCSLGYMQPYNVGSEKTPAGLICK